MKFLGLLKHNTDAAPVRKMKRWMVNFSGAGLIVAHQRGSLAPASTNYLLWVVRPGKPLFHLDCHFCSPQFHTDNTLLYKVALHWLIQTPDNIETLASIHLQRTKTALVIGLKSETAKLGRIQTKIAAIKDQQHSEDFIAALVIRSVAVSALPDDTPEVPISIDTAYNVALEGLHQFNLAMESRRQIMTNIVEGQYRGQLLTLRCASKTISDADLEQLRDMAVQAKLAPSELDLGYFAKEIDLAKTFYDHYPFIRQSWIYLLDSNTIETIVDYCLDRPLSHYQSLKTLVEGAQSQVPGFNRKMIVRDIISMKRQACGKQAEPVETE